MVRVLEFRTQPADLAARFLRRPFVVKRQQAFEDLLVGKVVRPAIGIEGRRIDRVMQLLDHPDEAAIEHIALGLRQRAAAAPVDLANPLQHVVQAGHGQVGETLQHVLARSIEALPQLRKNGPRRIGHDRERKFVETVGFLIPRIIPNTQPATGRQRPGDVNPG